MRPSGLSWVWLVLLTTCLILTVEQLSGARSGIGTQAAAATREKLPSTRMRPRKMMLYLPEDFFKKPKLTTAAEQQPPTRLGTRGSRRGRKPPVSVYESAAVTTEAGPAGKRPAVTSNEPDKKQENAASTQAVPAQLVLNPGRVKLARESTTKRQLLRRIPVPVTGRAQDNEPALSNNRRVHSDTGQSGRGQRRPSVTSGRPRMMNPVKKTDNSRLRNPLGGVRTDRPRIKLVKIFAGAPLVTKAVAEESQSGRRTHHTSGPKRIKQRITTTTTTTTTAAWPPDVAVPTQGIGMGGNPFGGILTKSDLFLMGKRLHPDWWDDISVGECPGEHLVVHDRLYFQCSRRDPNDLSDPYGMCLHGDSACKQSDPRSKCCYNGCADLCLKPSELVNEFCYEAMGSVRYQPGEEFMHGEWWCKCDPKKKSYQEMCTRLKCYLEDKEGGHEEPSSEGGSSTPESSEPESSEPESSEPESSESESSEPESSEPESSEPESSEPEGSEPEPSGEENPPKCKKGSKNCGSGKWKPKCKKGVGKCAWHKKPPRPVKTWNKGGWGGGKWKKHAVKKAKKHKFSFKATGKGKWKNTKWRKKTHTTWKKWGKRKHGKWNKWNKRRRPVKRRWGHKKPTWQKWKWRKNVNYRVVKKKSTVKWTLGRGSCQQIWVMGCDGTLLNEKRTLDLILAIRGSHYRWPEDFVRATSGDSSELSELLKTAYLDDFYYGGFPDALNWVFWVEGLRRACNTSVGDGVYPVTWQRSLRSWQAARAARLGETRGVELAFANNWTALWFDPLRDTCRRDVWLHYTAGRRQTTNAGAFQLVRHVGRTLDESTTNLEIGWLMRFVPMSRRYIWMTIILGSKYGWHGRPQYAILGSNWKYGARRYDYVLRSCYSIWSWGCNGTSVNETWARDWVKYSTANGFSWPHDFVGVVVDGDADAFLTDHGLAWPGLSVLNGTASDKVNWALWYDAYDRVCNATYGARNEEELTEALRQWRADREAELSPSDNVTVHGNWSDLWRYPVRHSCITKLKVYRRFAYNLVVKKGRRSKMSSWLQQYMKGGWNTAYFQRVSSWKTKQVGWSSYLDLSAFEGYGSCIDTWTPGCNSTLTNSSYLTMWQDLMDRAGFLWSDNFTLQTNNSFVQEIAERYLSDRNATELSDINWAFWFDGWQAMCNASLEEDGGPVNWTTILHEWASEWIDRLGEEPSRTVRWMELWMEPLLYMCNYTGVNDTIQEEFNNLLTMSTSVGTELVAGSLLGGEVRYEKFMEERMEEVRQERRHYHYDFNYGLCINVWTSVCDGEDLNMTQVEGLLQCIQRLTPRLDFMNYTTDEVKQLLDTTTFINMTDEETRLLDGLRDGDLSSTSDLVWKLWIGSWRGVCSKSYHNDLTFDEVLAALEDSFDNNQILQMGGTMDEWKKAWIKPWVGPCKGESFSCEYQEEYQEAGPIQWHFDCSVYVNETIQSFNWTSDGNDWMDKCGFDSETRFDWTDMEQVMKIWTDLCNAGTDVGMLPYTENSWDEDFDIACHKLKIFVIDDDT